MVRRNAGNDVKRASLFFVTLTRSVRMLVQPWGAPMIQPELSLRVSQNISRFRHQGRAARGVPDLSRRLLHLNDWDSKLRRRALPMMTKARCWSFVSLKSAETS